MICDLPFEIQNNIFYYLEHPITTMFKNEIGIYEHDQYRRLYWKDTDEHIRCSYFSENTIISFILEDNIRTKHIGRLSRSKTNDYDDFEEYLKHDVLSLLEEDDFEES